MSDFCISNQDRLAELMRAGQAETERGYVTMKAMTGTVGPNPLIEFFKNDPVVKELEIDADAIRETFWNGYFNNSACFCPLGWPVQLILGVPCFFFYSLSAVDLAVKAHHLILRVHSIEYRVDRYPSVGSRGEHVVKPVCSACEDGDAGGFHEVFPLSDVSDVQVQLCQAKCCDSNKLAPDTMVLKVSSYNGGMHAAAAIDGPKNGEDFAALVLQQQQRSKEAGGVQIPPDVAEKYTKYMSGFAGMGGMMGGLLGNQMTPVMNVQPGNANQIASMQAAQSAELGAVPPVTIGQVVIGETMQREAGEKDLATQLAELKALKDSGALDDDEFKAAKAKVLGGAGV
eukprot:CAMPEP_0119320302 /NCGR_PEP_ID=MMETSP1333-20130426/52120_1 /TAXON_ID=418940 /ORGANISM="Scyphosphaera apsteinii, Strain RCC1455" /LENGTH=342 /DNA_ID=CAMNT_0007326997 /DNA_START=12 /DNA_END=1040 /DNA_ORIENTATION=-